jgi:hypothetical protein
MVPPQTRQFQSGTERVWVEVCAASICRGSPALWNRWKQSGRRASPAPVGEKAEVADAHEAARKQVEEEAAQELIDGQGYEPLLVGVSGISPAEGDVAVGEGDESVVGDGDTVGVGTEIAQRVFRPAEGETTQSWWNRSLSQEVKVPWAASGARLP